jgi:hypothetical protein
MIKNRNLIVDAMVSSLTTYFSGLGTELITSVHNTLSVDFTNKASVITVTASGSNYHLDRFDGLYSIFPIAVNLFVVIPSVHHNLAPADLKPEVLLNDIEFQFFTWLLANQSTDHWNQLLPVGS